MWKRTRAYALIFAALIGGMVFCQIPERMAVAVQQGNAQVANLRQRLVSGLKIRTDGERQFIDEVLQRVEQNQIPLEMVDASFLWVRSNRRNYPYPFFYFERVLRLRGAREGVAIPPFDASTGSPNRSAGRTAPPPIR